MSVDESQRVLWFAEFEKLGESDVRMWMSLPQSQNEQRRLAAAIEWVRLRDRGRAEVEAILMRASSSKSVRWARHAAYAAYLAAFIAAIGAYDKIALLCSKLFSLFE